MSDLNPYRIQDNPSTELVNGLSNPPNKQVSGIGGWMILLAIGIVLSPIRLAAILWMTYVPIFSNGAWEALTTPGSENYRPLFGPVLIFEMAGNMLFLLAYFALAIFFFRKSRFFPAIYAVVSIANLLFILLDTWLGGLVMPEDPVFDADSIKELSRSVVSSCIWVPYVFISQRARNTFVE